MSKQGTLTAGRPSATKSRAATLASLADDTAMKRVNFELPADQHTKLKIYATRQGKTIKELLTEYVAQLPEI
ncbi:chromosome partitioning protein ParB [Acidithiobacillus ferrooxidans]|uniref:chromosome partitioning protein ParB n=1 Tax=Acidithiobacillus ferrooxidans TaxID=920 RepID=UPI0021493ED3|nr:chromosome partitioning protein ParB [Acidithiobacillus ferrooxidans]MCR1346411.1 chromosome partitioning protein ParB [Acidithiobacillus ferrooxidans]MCR1354878.1 chromosome partitioning protein ParB [Acidithiobacillus ferrooxidans]